MPARNQSPNSAGRLFYFVALDIGDEVDLQRASRMLEQAGKTTAASVDIGLVRPSIQFEAQHELEFEDSPLERVVVTIYHYGTVSVRYEFACAVTKPDELRDRSIKLREMVDQLIAEANRIVEQATALIRKSIRKPKLSVLMEDYVVYSLSLADEDPNEWISESEAVVAQALQLASEELSAASVTDTLKRRISHYKRDLAIVTWDSTLLINTALDKALALIEFLNAQLLATRVTKQIVDTELQRSFALLSAPFWRASGPKKVALMRAETAYLFADLRHTLGHIREEYLWLLHESVASVLGLEMAESEISGTLDAIESITGSMYNRATIIRMEWLTIVIILLITLEIVLGYLLH
ncbi:MAG: hypothetical protein KDD66_13705 [Bdellovibrionales bacterium]|nr:hypothetical protein [Bdellovibrionales bacterium]